MSRFGDFFAKLVQNFESSTTGEEANVIKLVLKVIDGFGQNLRQDFKMFKHLMKMKHFFMEEHDGDWKNKDKPKNGWGMGKGKGNGKGNGFGNGRHNFSDFTSFDMESEDSQGMKEEKINLFFILISRSS